MKEKLSARIGLVNLSNTLENIKNISQGNIPNVEATLFGVKCTIINFSYIKSQLSTIHSWIRGVMYVLLLLFNFNQFYKLIRGSDIVGVGQTLSNMKGEGGQ